MLSLLLALQLEPEWFCVKVRRELICVRDAKALCACQPGRPHGPIHLRRTWWRAPYIS